MKLLKFAAFLSNPERPLKIENFLISPQEAAQLIQILGENKIPLIFLKEKAAPVFKDIIEHPEFKKAFANEYDYFNRIKEEYLKIKKEFQKLGIEDILFKSNGLFPYKSDNLDILIKPQFIETAKSILLNLDYIELTHWEDEPGKYLFRKFNIGEEVLTVHLHKKIGWDGPSILKEDLLWNRSLLSKSDPSIRIPSPEDNLMIVLSHAFYENRYINLSDLKLVNDCLKTPNFDWNYIETVASEKKWKSVFYTALLLFASVEKTIYKESLFPENIISEARKNTKKIRWFYPFPKIPVIKNDKIFMPFRFSKLSTKPFTYIRILTSTEKLFNKLQYIFFDIIHATQSLLGIKRIIRQKPALFTLSGIDGSGKTDLAKILSKAFISCQIKVKYVWIRPRFSNSTENFKKILRKFLSNKIPSPDETEKKQKFFKKTGVRFFWKNFVFINLFWQVLLKIRIPLFFRKIVISDRYLLDNLVDLALILKEPQFIEKGFLKKSFFQYLINFFPKPTISFFLDTPPKIAHERIKEESIEDLEKLNVLYQNGKDNFNIKKIDTIPNLNLVSNKIVNIALTYYFKNFFDYSIKVKKSANF